VLVDDVLAVAVLVDVDVAVAVLVDVEEMVLVALDVDVELVQVPHISGHRRCTGSTISSKNVWPTAARVVAQNGFRFAVQNDSSATPKQLGVVVVVVVVMVVVVAVVVVAVVLVDTEVDEPVVVLLEVDVDVVVVVRQPHRLGQSEK